MNKRESRVLVKWQRRKDQLPALAGKASWSSVMQNQPTQAALYHRKSWKTKAISSLHLKVEQLKKLNSELHEQPAKAAKREVAALLGPKPQRRK